VRTLASIICGLIAGWLVLTEPATIPDALKQLIGEQIARNQYLDQIIDFLHLSSDTAYYIKFWLILFLVAVIPLSLYALAATTIFIWGGKGRYIFYSSLCIPLLSIAIAVVMFNFYGVEFSYMRGSIRHFDVEIFNIIIYSCLFYSFIGLAKRYKLVRSSA
jgi:heme/copper-type cytochrome/quinol oxidase subunit 4